MIRERINELRRELGERGFNSSTTSYPMDKIFAGLDLLELRMRSASTLSNAQHEFDVIYDGIEKNVDLLKGVVRDIDARLRTPVA
jgi:hypothetical protein